MRSSEKGYVLVLDDQDRPSRWVSAEDIERDGASLEEVGRPAVAIVEASSSLYSTLDTMITSYKGSAIVVDGEGRYQGVVDFDTVLEAINAMRPQVQTRDRAEQDLRTGDGGR